METKLPGNNYVLWNQVSYIESYLICSPFVQYSHQTNLEREESNIHLKFLRHFLNFKINFKIYYPSQPLTSNLTPLDLISNWVCSNYCISIQVSWLFMAKAVGWGCARDRLTKSWCRIAFRHFSLTQHKEIFWDWIPYHGLKWTQLTKDLNPGRHNAIFHPRKYPEINQICSDGKVKPHFLAQTVAVW